MSLLNAGRVGRPHGLDGSFHVTRPRGLLLRLGGAVRIGEAVHEIVRRAGTEDRPILRLHGIDDRPGAEALRAKPVKPVRKEGDDVQAHRYSRGPRRTPT